MNDTTTRRRDEVGRAAKRTAKAPAHGLKKVWQAYGWFILGLLLGGGLIASVWLMPDGPVYAGLQIALTILYGISYILLLVTRLQRIYRGHYFWLETGLVFVTLIGVLATFALCHLKSGVLDTTVSPMQETRNFNYCMYLSVATFTTVGFGDFSPLGIGRALACVQAFVGYVTLALVASTAATLLQDKAEAEMDEDEQTAVEQGFSLGSAKKATDGD